jgi:uncharacterized membrane protein YhaH (DUF805 family)
MGYVSIMPFGRLSLIGFWFGMILVGGIVAAGYVADTRGALPAGWAPWWPLPIQNEHVANALAYAPGPATAIAGAIGAYLLLMAMIRRLHDRGFGGLMLIWKIIGMVGLGWVAWNIERYVPGTTGTVIAAVTGIVFGLLLLRLLIICILLPGQFGDNRYGRDPAGKHE